MSSKGFTLVKVVSVQEFITMHSRESGAITQVMEWSFDAKQKIALGQVASVGFRAGAEFENKRLDLG